MRVHFTIDGHSVPVPEGSSARRPGGPATGNDDGRTLAMKSDRPYGTNTLDRGADRAAPALDRRRLLAFGGLLAGGAAVAHAGTAKGVEASASPNAADETRRDEPTAHQRTYYEKARF